MKTIQDKALYDFLKCPFYFYVRHILKISLLDTAPINNLVDEVVHHFYTNLLNGKIKTYKELEEKWDLIIKPYSFDNKTILENWGKILRIAQWTQKNKIVVGDVNCDYLYNTKDYTIKGTIDFVIVRDKKEIELLYFDYSQRRLDPVDMHKKTKYLADYFGFYTVYQQLPKRARIFHVKTGEEHILTFNAQDKCRLDMTLNHVCDIIAQSLYYPHENHMCASCIAKNYCSHIYSKKEK